MLREGYHIDGKLLKQFQSLKKDYKIKLKDIAPWQTFAVPQKYY